MGFAIFVTPCCGFVFYFSAALATDEGVSTGAGIAASSLFTEVQNGSSLICSPEMFALPM
jgi:hypothetical protein